MPYAAANLGHKDIRVLAAPRPLCERGFQPRLHLLFRDRMIPRCITAGGMDWRPVHISAPSPARPLPLRRGLLLFLVRTRRRGGRRGLDHCTCASVLSRPGHGVCRKDPLTRRPARGVCRAASTGCGLAHAALLSLAAAGRVRVLRFKEFKDPVLQHDCFRSWLKFVWRSFRTPSGTGDL